MNAKDFSVTFFMQMIPPTATHQEQATVIRNGRPARYDPPALKDARAKLTAHLAHHLAVLRETGRFPDAPIPKGVPVALDVSWYFPGGPEPEPGESVGIAAHTQRPDTDNLEKLLKDCMTRVGYWADDAQVYSETVSKHRVNPISNCGIEIMIQTCSDD